ncbi:response regulator transcription factor [Streptomyces canus]|uniref:response regulator transcription factor n=1 Tax=Streptomyces canus TaxID=58343 RepID=UPI001ABFDCB3|nr:response regulator transcription factor [Streptomyces canus]
MVVVDDHPFVRLGLRSFFELVDEVDLLGEAASVAEAERLIADIAGRDRPPDVVLMDILLPDGDGITATAGLLGRYPGIAVVALTSVSDGNRVRSALQAGAVGYVLKDAGPDELLAAVRAAARGEGGVGASLALKLAEPRPPGASSLTAREWEVLALVSEGRSNREVAEELVVSERTARTHVSKVLQKLGLRSRTQAALWARREGLAPRE